MNFASPNTVRRLLGELNLKPGKSMGQNFLIDGNILGIILDYADLKASDQVLEIGPGLGVVTRALIERTARVVAIEKDIKLYDFLGSENLETGNLELIHADALDADLAAIMESGITKVVSNLPYSVGSRILVDILKASAKPRRIVVTLQHDVAGRIAAPVGGREYGLLAILAQRFYEVEIVKEIGPNCFLPRPRVGSALLVCRLRSSPLGPVNDERFFLQVVKMAFTHRRKVIVNALRGAGFDLEQIVPALCAVGIDERLRPSALSVCDWCRLSNSLLESVSSGD